MYSNRSGLEGSYRSRPVVIDFKEGIKSEGFDDPCDFTLWVEQLDVLGLVHAFFLLGVEQVGDGVDCPEAGAAHVLNFAHGQQNVHTAHGLTSSTLYEYYV
jgi:hypothetical protein